MNEVQAKIETERREVAVQHNITRQQYDFVYDHLMEGNSKEDMCDMLILYMHTRDINDIVVRYEQDIKDADEVKKIDNVKRSHSCN